MTTDDNGMYTSAASRRTRRTKLAAVGAAGLLAILGVGGAVYQLTDDNDSGPAEPGAMGVAVDASTAPAPASPSRSAAGRVKPKAAAAAPTPSPTPSPVHRKTDAERKKAMVGKAAAEARNLVKQPLPPAGGTAASVSNVTVTRTGKPGNSLKVVSAGQDLTGYRELAWVADEGEAVGDARCTSTIRLSNAAEPRERPTLLLCWRTSATKSVYTVAVDSKGRPSKKASVAAIDERWAKLD
jgi:hypothetical protein